MNQNKITKTTFELHCLHCKKQQQRNNSINKVIDANFFTTTTQVAVPKVKPVNAN
jgi:hypothetical protein